MSHFCLCGCLAHLKAPPVIHVACVGAAQSSAPKWLMKIWGCIQLLRPSEMIWGTQLAFSSSCRRACISYRHYVLYAIPTMSIWSD